MSDVNLAIEDLRDVFGMIAEALLDQGCHTHPTYITESCSGKLGISHLGVNGTHSGQPLLPLQAPSIQPPPVFPPLQTPSSLVDSPTVTLQ